MNQTNLLSFMELAYKNLTETSFLGYKTSKI